MRRAIWPLACSGLVGLGVVIGAGCGSDDPAPVGAGGSGIGGAAGAAGQSGSSAFCTAKPPADPAPGLTGVWAWKTVGSRLMPKTALTAEFRTRTVSILLAQQTLTGTDLSVTAQYCDQYNEEDPGAVTHVTIPAAYVSTLAPFTRTGTYLPQGDGGAATLSMPTFTEVVGAQIADPANGALPTAAADPQVVDQDGDGKPGVTIKIGGLVSGDLYVVQRQKSDLSGIATGSLRVEGHYGFTSEQVILGSTSALLQSAASGQQAVTDPNTCASTFTMVRLGDAATCADVLANRAILFP
jgi:hypothetical protein